MGIAALLVLGLTLTTVGCGRNEPPGARSAAPPASHRVHVSAEALAASAVPWPEAAATPGATQRGPAPAPSHPDEPGDAAARSPVAELQTVEREPTLVDARGEPLPQTDQRPAASSPSFRRRMAQLCLAIIEGVPEKAHGAFFPMVAYNQVKAVADPARDYRLRLLTHFDRDILEYHRRLSRRPGPFRCGEATVPENQARWMKPGSEYNRLGYFRVLRSRLQLSDAADKSISFEITSMISWRGEWYVVHLNGFE